MEMLLYSSTPYEGCLLYTSGLNNGGKTISNVGPGVNGTDAVNVNQLKGVTEGMANAINSVAGETQRVGAHAAAMSALKPIQYDPLEPTQVLSLIHILAVR